MLVIKLNLCYLNQVKHSKPSAMLYLNYVKQNTTSVYCLSTHVKQNANNDKYLSNYVTHKTSNIFVLINLSSGSQPGCQLQCSRVPRDVAMLRLILLVKTPTK